MDEQVVDDYTGTFFMNAVGEPKFFWPLHGCGYLIVSITHVRLRINNILNSFNKPTDRPTDQPTNRQINNKTKK